MSDLYSPNYARGGYGKYNKNKSFISMEAGTDALFLEDEANELQWIQNELRADLIRKEYYSGVYKKEKNDIITSAKIFTQNKQIFDSFLIKPMIVNINGYFIDIIGNNGFNNQSKISGKYDSIDINKLNYIQLPPPPSEGNFYDFVYLEMCFAEVKFSDDLWFSGNTNNSFGLIKNDLFDRRINGESNRRIQLNWNIYTSRVPLNFIPGINNTPADIIPDNLPNTLFDESVYAQYTPAKGAYHKNSTYGFWNATLKLDSKTDSDDIGLWIAGTGLDENNESRLRTTNGYSYAIPLFKILRRNTASYYHANLLGGDLLADNGNSYTKRPDGKFANIIYEDDIIDLRNIIRINNIEKVLHEGFENLLLNKSTRETKIFSTFFGVDKIEPDINTILYEGCNSTDFDSTLLRNRKEYSFVPGVEQEGVLLGESTYFAKEFTIYNANIKGLTGQFFIKAPNNNIGLYTLSDTVSGARLISYIENEKLFVICDQSVITYNYKKHFNKFTHIAIAVKDTVLELIINNKIIQRISLDRDVNFNDNFTVKIGYADVKSYFCKDCIFDEIEISHTYKNQFNHIPKSLSSDNADINIDSQLNRKNYTSISDADTYTYHKTYRTDNDGQLHFKLTLPLTLSFTDDYPIIYFDNESVQVDTEVSVSWEKQKDNWYCTINGLGNYVTYTLVIIASVKYPGNQGFANLPKIAYAAYTEKSNKTFYAVADTLETQEHNLGYARADKLFNEKDKLIAYNPYVMPTGFCTALKYTTVINTRLPSIKADEYMKIIGVYSVMLNGENILNSYYFNGESYILTLSQRIDEPTEVDIYLVTEQNCCVYSPTKSGILNLYKVEEINDYGNGTRTTFTYRSESKIMSFLQANFLQQTYPYAFVNGQPQKVSVTIDGTFVHFTFDTPPVNKADIKTYIVSEYDPLRSERIEFVYQVDVENNNTNNIIELNNSDIIYTNKEIFVTTDGYGIYPYKKDLNIGGQEIKLNYKSIPADSLVINPDINNNIGDLAIVVDDDQVQYDQDQLSATDSTNSYGSLRFITSDDNVHSSNYTSSKNINFNTIGNNNTIEYNNVTGNNSVINNDETVTVKTNDNMSYTLEIQDGQLSIFKLTKDNNDVTAMANDNIDQYTLYMMNKIMPSLDYLPAIEPLKFNLTPVDILKSNQCNIIFDSKNEAHIIVKDSLPVSTNLSAQINYCIPNTSGTFLTTFNKLNTTGAVSVAKGYRNCSIDNKSFYSLTSLEEKILHVNVLPFLIKDKNHILKLGVFTTLANNNMIYIDATASAMDIFSLNTNYLIRHI